MGSDYLFGHESPINVHVCACLWKVFTNEFGIISRGHYTSEFGVTECYLISAVTFF